MPDWSALIEQHGYLLIGAVAFLEAIGLPIPASLALVAAGAASAMGVLRPGVVIVVAVLAIVIGDSLLYLLGRRTGWWFLNILCRVSINPESCVLRSAESFYKRGKATLVIAKFIPGINTMAPPLAGSMKMGPHQFLLLDLAGAFLYVTVCGGLGFMFSGFLELLTRSFHTVGRGVEWLLVVGVIGYVGYYAVLFWKHRVYRVVPRIQAQELAEKLASEAGEKVMVVDVRSQGYYDHNASRIRGSVRLEPSQLRKAIHELPKDKEIYVYCT